MQEKMMLGMKRDIELKVNGHNDTKEPIGVKPIYYPKSYPNPKIPRNTKKRHPPQHAREGVSSISNPHPTSKTTTNNYRTTEES